jgi:hypothetical protein
VEQQVQVELVQLQPLREQLELQAETAETVEIRRSALLWPFKVVVVALLELLVVLQRLEPAVVAA